LSSARAILEYPTEKRDALWQRFRSKLQPHLHLDRTLVSYQANRSHPLFGWFKYREGFSTTLVQTILSQVSDKPATLLDPFAGSGVALFAARKSGWKPIGIELLPVGTFVVDALQAAERVQPTTFKRYVDRAGYENWEDHYDKRFALKHITITRGAFSPRTERAIAGYRAFCKRKVRNPDVRRLLDFACFCVLESVSFTRKDGQYLRWDRRARNGRTKSRFDKGRIPTFKAAIELKLQQIYNDLLNQCQSERPPFAAKRNDHNKCGAIDVRTGSCLHVLPEIPADSIDLVFTSPPYCNRYDYTRTYALELVYLGLNDDDVKTLRQTMLSCTVENKCKEAELAALYGGLNRPRVYDRVKTVFEQQAALYEILDILDSLNERRALNNPNIPRMVRNYFLEMSFVIYELARVVRPGGRVVMVNDNVRYAGQEVPVDLILSNIAAAFGLTTDHIWTLARGKGNSSQQMGTHGRRELRKCVYVWRKQ